MKRLKIISLAFLCLDFAAPVRAVPDFFDTGVDGKHQQLTGGEQDPHYQLRQVIAYGLAGNSNWSPAIVMQSAIDWSAWLQPVDARWIYVANAANLGQDWGWYDFQTTFNLSGYDPSTAVLSGSWAMDQYGTISLNGNQVASLADGNWNGNLTPFILTSGFVPGTNVLTFHVRFPDGGDGIIVSGATLTVSPIPALGLAFDGKAASVFWPASATNYVLECTTNLASPNWVTNAYGTIISNTNYLPVAGGPSTLFFRLKH